MTRHTHGFAGLLLTVVALAAPASAWAQSARNGNVYNGTAHEPAAGAVQRNEAAVGVAPPEQKAQQENHDLDVMGRQLTDKANRDAASAPPMPRPPNASGR